MLGGLAPVIWVFVPPFPHLSNEDMLLTLLWAVGRLNHMRAAPIKKKNPARHACIFHSPRLRAFRTDLVSALGRVSLSLHYVSSLLVTDQWLALTGTCTRGPAPWMTANAAQEAERDTEAQENTGCQVLGSFHPVSCQTDLLEESQRAPRPGLLRLRANSWRADYSSAFPLSSRPSRPYTVPQPTA